MKGTLEWGGREKWTQVYKGDNSTSWHDKEKMNSNKRAIMAWRALSPRNENGKCCINLRKEGTKDIRHHHGGAVERDLALHAWERGQAGLQKCWKQRGAHGGRMQNRRMQWACPVLAMKTRALCAIDPSRLILDNLHAQPFPTLLTHSLAWRKDCKIWTCLGHRM